MKLTLSYTNPSTPADRLELSLEQRPDGSVDLYAGDPEEHVYSTYGVLDRDQLAELHAITGLLLGDSGEPVRLSPVVLQALTDAVPIQALKEQIVRELKDDGWVARRG